MIRLAKERFNSDPRHFLTLGDEYESQIDLGL